MTPNITQTLRDALFEKVILPPVRGTAFKELVPAMFPARAHFIHFLESRDVQAQAETAKTILLAMAYESTLFPPNKFIINLLDFETRVAGQAGGGNFIARDHFIHLVHLYLIGLYAFWYHSTFHKLLFENVRASLPKEAPHDRLSLLRACIEAWRTFVLFHDLGYPWEASAQVQDSKPYTEPFNRSKAYTAKDSALHALSQLMAMEWLVTEEITTLGDVLEHLPPPQAVAPDEFPFPDPKLAGWPAEFESLRTAVRLPNLGDYKLVHLIGTIMGDGHLVPVVESIVNEQPCASSRPILDAFLGTRQFRLRTKRPSCSEAQKWVKEFELPPELADSFRLAFYVKDFKASFKSYQDKIFTIPQEVEHPSTSFGAFVQDFVARQSPEWPTDPEARFTDFAFAIYHRLLKTLDFDALDSIHNPLDLHWALSKGEFSGLQGVILRRVTEVIDRKLTEQARKLKAAGSANFAQTRLKTYLKKLTVVLRDEELPDDLEASLSDTVKDQLALKSNLYSFYRALRDPILGHIGPPLPFVVPPQKTKKGPTVSNAPTKPDISQLIHGEAGRLAVHLMEQRGLGGLDLLQTYRPSYINDRQAPGYTDHGIAAGLFISAMHHSLGELHRQAPPNLSLLLKRGGMPRPDQRWEITHAANGLVAEIIYSILIHNLYPEEFTDTHKSFRTKQRPSTFSYFALFCDNLQHWDRRFLMNLAQGHLPYGVQADKFNIEIVNNHFRILERGPKVELSERQKRLREQLDDFLENASRMINLGLIEW